MSPENENVRKDMLALPLFRIMLCTTRTANNLNVYFRILSFRKLEGILQFEKEGIYSNRFAR